MKHNHRVYLILGSNIIPESNLQSAIDLLQNFGDLGSVSTVWESNAVGSGGPNFLNAAVLFLTATESSELKAKVIRPIENSLGRVRSEDANAPRMIDIDIVMVDEEVLNVDRWWNAYVVVPMAELLPNELNPNGNETLQVAAAKLRKKIWITPRADIALSIEKRND